MSTTDVTTIEDFDCQQDQCPVVESDCDWLFGSRFVIKPLIYGSTSITWSLNANFPLPDNAVFTLQVGYQAVSDASNWKDVAETTSTSWIVDPRQRVFGQDIFTCYRIKLSLPATPSTQAQEFYSRPFEVNGNLQYVDWMNFQARQRAWHIQLSKAGTPGHLFKRRITGKPCPKCASRQTQEPQNSMCPMCFGTGLICGYFDAIACFYMMLQPAGRDIRIELEGRGIVDKMRQLQGRCLSDPEPVSGDVWRNDQTDARCVIGVVKNAEEIRGVPIIHDVGMCPLATDHAVYMLPVVGS